jgi:hypothetical protein
MPRVTNLRDVSRFMAHRPLLAFPVAIELAIAIGSTVSGQGLIGSLFFLAVVLQLFSSWMWNGRSFR